MSTVACSASPRRRGARLVNGDRMWHYVEGIENYAPVWADARHPDPARAVEHVVRRDRQAPAGAAVPRLRHARHPRVPALDRLRPLLVRPRPVDHREGVRALRQRAEPRPHRAAACASCCGSGSARVRPSRSRRSRRRARTSWSPTPWTTCSPACGASLPRSSSTPIQHPARARGARPRARQQVHEGRADHRASAAPATTWATSSSGWRSRTRSSTRAHRPLIAVKLHVLTRKSLGGIQTDLDSRALDAQGQPGPGALRGRRGRAASAAAACTATARSRAPSSADASSPAVRPAGRSRRSSSRERYPESRALPDFG